MSNKCDSIELYCSKCLSRKIVDRCEDDPPNAVLAHIQCPECVCGDFDTTYYFDAKGLEIPYESTAPQKNNQMTCNRSQSNYNRSESGEWPVIWPDKKRDVLGHDPYNYTGTRL